MGANRRARRPAPIYNVLFPVWLLVWIPSWLWLGLVPANYAIDTLVLRWGLRRHSPQHEGRLMSASWRVCWRGFVADFVGAALILAAQLLLDGAQEGVGADIAQALGMNPFANAWALLVMLLALAVSGLCVYALDRRLLTRAYGIERAQAHRIALLMAIATAPYLFLLPAELLYRF